MCTLGVRCMPGACETREINPNSTPFVTVFIIYYPYSTGLHVSRLASHARVVTCNAHANEAEAPRSRSG
jgi:hypothetical protein